MKISKTPYKPPTTSVPENGAPPNVVDPNLPVPAKSAVPSNFLDAEETTVTPIETGNGLIGNIFGRMANIVETAAPNQGEIKDVAAEVTSNLRDAFSLVTGVVAGDVPDNSSRRMSTSSASGGRRNLMDIIAASGDKEIPAPAVEKPTKATVSPMLKIKQGIKEVLAAQSRSLEGSDAGEDSKDSAPSVPLKSETTFVPVSVTDNVREISNAISRMQKAISAFGRSEVDERPLSPRESERPRTRTEQLVDDMNRRKAVWKSQGEAAAQVQKSSKKKKSMQEQSAALIQKIEEKMVNIRTKKLNDDGTAVPDVLDSHRGDIPARRRRPSKLTEIAEIIDVNEAESLMSSQVVSPAASSRAATETPSKSFVSDEPEIIELPSAAASPETRPKSPRSVLSKAASSPSLQSHSSKKGDQSSEAESVSSHPRKWLAMPENAAKPEAPKPIPVTTKPDEDRDGKESASPKSAGRSAGASPRGGMISPVGAARRARRQYCQRCSRIISNRDLEDLLAEDESKKWTTCASCIKTQFHTLTARMTPTGGVLRIGTRDGEFLDELSATSNIPIRWVSGGQERVFANALCLVLYELCDNKSVLLRNPNESIGYEDLQPLLDNDLVHLPPEWKARAPGILRSVLKMQTEQHPMLRKLLFHIMERKTTPKFLPVPHPYIPEELGDIWLEIADQVNVDYKGVN